ncbi:MAG TPA: hypothetical protein PK011_08155 [Marinagarivorans sp.]|nr:hypothetical protein [Marinagarivorans sp.]
MRILLPLVLSGGLLAPVGALAADSPVNILGQKQTAKILEFPDMSLNQMDYRGISVEFAVGGESNLRAITPIKVPLNCNGKETAITQLEVSYDLPKIFVRVHDSVHNTQKYDKALPSEGKLLLGDASCDAKNDVVALEANFRSKLTDWLKGQTRQEMQGAKRRVEAFVQENTVVAYKPLEITSFQFRSESGEFSNINQAYDIATKAYAMIEEKDTLSEPVECIKGAIELWEMAMGNPQINARTDAKKIKAAIAYNLSSAYWVAMNYMQASAYHKLARMLNEESGATLKLPDYQARIDRQLRNRSLSNNVPNTPVAMVTLERMGSEYIKHAEIVELTPENFKAGPRQLSAAD